MALAGNSSRERVRIWLLRTEVETRRITAYIDFRTPLLTSEETPWKVRGPVFRLVIRFLAAVLGRRFEGIGPVASLAQVSWFW